MSIQNSNLPYLDSLLRQYEALKEKPVYLTSKDGVIGFQQKPKFGKRRSEENNFEKNAKKLKEYIATIHKNPNSLSTEQLKQLEEFQNWFNKLVVKVIVEKNRPNWFLRLFGKKTDIQKIYKTVSQYELGFVWKPLAISSSVQGKQNNPLRMNLEATFSKKHIKVEDYAKPITEEIKKDESLQSQVISFKTKFSGNIKTIQMKSWKQLKADRGLQMGQKFGDEPVSMQTFRDEANKLVDTITLEMAKKMGLPEVKWSACGTVGWNSDVDTALLPGKGVTLTPAEASLYKSLRDMVHVSIFGGLSGVQLDTESYIPHIATLNTMKGGDKLAGFTERFYTHEMANICLQRYISLAKHPEQYKESKEKDLAAIKNPEQKAAMEAVYTSVEEVMQAINKEIWDIMLQRSGTNPAEYKIMSEDRREALVKTIMEAADITYKLSREAAVIPIRMKLATKSEEVEAEIRQMEAKKPVPQAELSALHLERNKIYILLNLLQDEGTMSQAEGTVTLFAEGGQIYQGTLKKMAKELKQQKVRKEEAVASVVGSSLKPEDKEKLQKKIKIDDSASSDKEMDALAAQFNQIILDDVLDKYDQSRFEKAGPRELLTAAYEEEAQFRHVINDGLHKATEKYEEVIAKATEGSVPGFVSAAGDILGTVEGRREVSTEGGKREAPAVDSTLIAEAKIASDLEAGKGAINAGKYCLRTTDNTFRALTALKADYMAKKKELPAGFDALFKQVEALRYKAAQLECCKRKFTLNQVAAKKLLEEHVGSYLNDKVGLTDLQKLDIFDELPGRLNRFVLDKSLPKSDNFQNIIKLLIEKPPLIGHMEDTDATGKVIYEVKDERVKHILEAFVGYSREKDHHKDLKAIHDKADKITLEELKLTDKEQVEAFAEEIEKTGQQVREMLTITGDLPTASLDEAKKLDFAALVK